ncbi:hypothetical protein ACGYLO_20435 [Sulfitobacter sp. 1A13353]|uniref:hypothetical protein n=1 Tax=Sulfitobacter sp. 1A13353 TaxID=3368568 RepID=UPI003744D0F0
MEVYLKSLEQCIEAGNWPAALCLALSLPDMAGTVENPNGEPRQRYMDWFNDWIGPKYRTQLLMGQQTFLSGADCYGLRCAVLYQGQDASEARHRHNVNIFERFRFTISKADHCVRKSHNFHLNAERFCRDLMEGCEAWLKSARRDPEKAAVLGRTLKIESA